MEVASSTSVHRFKDGAPDNPSKASQGQNWSHAAITIELPEIPTEFPTEVKDNGDLVADELALFNNPLSVVPLSLLAQAGLILIWESLLYGAALLGSTLLNNFGSILLNRSGSPTQQAAVGVALAFNRWFYYGIFQGLYEKFGIDLSRHYGAKNYHLTKIHFYQGLVVLFTTFTFITLPGYFFSEQILLAIGSPPELAAAVVQTLRPLAVADGIETTAEFLICFCNSQGHEHLFGKLALLSLGPSLFAAYYFIEVLKCGTVGWVYSKLVYDTITLIIGVTVMIRCANSETWGSLSYYDLTTGLGNSFVDSFKYALGSYTECLGYIIGDYFVILTHDENQIAAFTITMNMTTLPYCLGDAFATIMRTRMNILIGKKQNQAAKNFAIFFSFVMAIFTAILIVGMFLLRYPIAAAYTGNTHQLNHLFLNMLILIALYLPVDIFFHSVGIAMKTLGLIEWFISLNLGFFIFANLAFCTIIHFLGLMSAAMAYSVIGVLGYLVTTISIYRISNFDCTKIDLQPDSLEYENLLDD